MDLFNLPNKLLPRLTAAVIASTTTSQTGIAVNTWTTRNFGSETLDTDNFHHNVTGLSKLYFPRPGKWLVASTLFLDASGVTSPQVGGLRILLNGSTTTTYGKALVLTGSATTVVSSGVALILANNPGDYVEVQAICTGSAGTFAMTTSTDDQFLAFYVGE